MHAQMNSWPAYCMYIYMYKCQQTAEMIHINTFNACTYTLQPFQTKTSLDFRNNPVSKRPGFPTTKYITSWWPQPVWTNTIQNGSFPLVRVKIKHFQNHLDYTIVFVWTFLKGYWIFPILFPWLFLPGSLQNMGMSVANFEPKHWKLQIPMPQWNEDMNLSKCILGTVSDPSDLVLIKGNDFVYAIKIFHDPLNFWQLHFQFQWSSASVHLNSSVLIQFL